MSLGWILPLAATVRLEISDGGTKVVADIYVSPVNFPFVAIAPDGVHTLRKGTPLVQVIPFPRDGDRTDAVIRPETEQDAMQREHVYRNTLAVDGWYRRRSRAQR